MASSDDIVPAAPEPRIRPATPTIRDVARLADVSIGTASKALNANGRLSLETREKVLRVARELGYRPNDLAQSLHRNKSKTIGILSNDSFGRFTFPIVEAMEEKLADHGIAVFMCNATDDPERERQHLDQLLGKRIDGPRGGRPGVLDKLSCRVGPYVGGTAGDLRFRAGRRRRAALSLWCPTTRVGHGSPPSI